MCGIAAIYNIKESKEDNLISIKKILQSINHRGPDQQNHILVNQCYLGIARLSIIDLKNGNQPIVDSTKRFHIVFNGEIYNYLFLKKALENLNFSFKTNSDTEVVLYSYIQWGEKFAEKLDGMFSIIIYDKINNELIICRDRFGKKPLYYYKDDKKIIICSEVKAISDLRKENLLDLKLNNQGYWDYLTYRYIPGNQTSYKNIFKFDRGSIYKIQNNKISKKKYWKINFKDTKNETLETKNFNFKKLFENSVKKRLISDVPVGVILSGGLDSSAILYSASKYQKINSYHVCFKNETDNYNEYKYAKKIAKHLNSNLKVIEIDDYMFLDKLGHINKYTDEPISDLASIPLKFVSDLAAKEVKVVLSGEGADEIMAGYDLYNVQKNIKYLQNLNKYKPISIIIKKIFRLFFSKKFSALDKIGLNHENYASQVFKNITYQISDAEKTSLLKFKDNTFLKSERFIEKNYLECKNLDQINQILYVISKEWLIENVLMKSDKVTMSSSLECRCPFLDKDLTDFYFQMSGKEKIYNNKGKLDQKILLKEYLKGNVPNDIINRKKLGFPVRAYNLDKKIYKDFLFDHLSSQKTYYENFFIKKEILNKVDLSIKQKNENIKNFLWSIVIYEIWKKNNSLA
jgi:asparagine synthase (glutamine-hydrolysing)